jgi:two-component system cell cycle response regulator DivK
MNILLIEDSRFMRGLVTKTLTRAGYEVTAVADGEEGVLAARAVHPALILLDMMLPGLDGTCVLRKLKQDALTAHIPVVVMTGLSQRNEARLKKAGAAAYIEKTLLRLDESADALIPVVESTIGTSSQDRALSAPASSQLGACLTNKQVGDRSKGRVR